MFEFSDRGQPPPLIIVDPFSAMCSSLMSREGEGLGLGAR